MIVWLVWLVGCLVGLVGWVFGADGVDLVFGGGWGLIVWLGVWLGVCFGLFVCLFGWLFLSVQVVCVRSLSSFNHCKPLHQPGAASRARARTPIAPSPNAPMKTMDGAISSATRNSSRTSLGPGGGRGGLGARFRGQGLRAWGPEFGGVGWGFWSEGPGPGRPAKRAETGRGCTKWTETDKVEFKSKNEAEKRQSAPATHRPRGTFG